MKTKPIFVAIAVVLVLAFSAKYRNIVLINPCQVYYEVSHNPPFFELYFIQNAPRNNNSKTTAVNDQFRDQPQPGNGWILPLKNDNEQRLRCP